MLFRVFCKQHGFPEGITLPKQNLKGMQAIQLLFCNNIINYEIEQCFSKYVFHVHCMMLDILIFLNEGIAKFFTLMLKGPLEQNYGV